MSPVTGCLGYRDEFFSTVHMLNFSPVDQHEIQGNKTKMAAHKVASLATIVALSTLVTLLIELLRLLQKWKHIPGKIMPFCPVTGLECPYWKISISVPEI